MKTDFELTEHVKNLSRTSFGWEFIHKAKWNSRLKTTGGRFFPKDMHLDFNPKLAEHENFDKIILHELVHYHLYQQKRGYKHQDVDFKQLLAQVGGLRYAPVVEKKEYKYFYDCENCGQSYPRMRKMDTQKYRCGKCRGRLRAR